MFLQKVTVQDVQLRTDDLLHITQRELKQASDFCGVNLEVYMSMTDVTLNTHILFVLQVHQSVIHPGMNYQYQFCVPSDDTSDEKQPPLLDLTLDLLHI